MIPPDDARAAKAITTAEVAIGKAAEAASLADERSIKQDQRIRNLRRAVAALAVGLVVVAFVASAALYGVITRADAKVEQAKSAGKKERVEITRKADNAQVKADKVQTRVVRLERRIYGTGPAGSAGSRGASGRAPTPREIAAAVAVYCAGGNCVGPAGKTGERGPAGVLGPIGPMGLIGLTGRGPTTEEIAMVVTAYCAAHDGCRGRAGEKGDKGSSGTDGTNGTDGAEGAPGAPGATGPQGPGPTDEQIRSALDAYCLQNGCVVVPTTPTDPAPTEPTP